MNLNDLESVISHVEQEPTIEKNVLLGLYIIFAFLIFVLIWSIFSTLESASVSDGHFIVEGERKAVQHLEGGIIQVIHVQEGQTIEQGAPILTLDGTQIKAKILLMKGQFYEHASSKARILAELSNHTSLVFSQDLLSEAQKNVSVHSVLQRQQDLFAANSNGYYGQVKILNQRIYQYEMQIESLQAQVKSKSTQLTLINEEKDAVAYLEARKLIEKPRLLSLKREAARLMGDRDETMGQISKTQQSIGETQAQIYELNEQRRKDLLKELQDDEKALSDLTQQLYAAQDIFNRLVITSPKRGIVLNLSTHTLGGVVTPGQTVCEIVPDHNAMLLQVRIKPLDIDVVSPGLPVKIRLTAYKQRNTPTFLGQVTHVDPDTILDPKTNDYYYKSYINFMPSERKKLRQYKIYPGMPAQAMIITNHMSPLGYILSPIKESFNKAFRDD